MLGGSLEQLHIDRVKLFPTASLLIFGINIKLTSSGCVENIEGRVYL